MRTAPPTLYAAHVSWPSTPQALQAAQRGIGALSPPAWEPADDALTIAGCFVCFPRAATGPGGAGEPAWAAAVAMRASNVEAETVLEGVSGASYEAGLLALREGALLEATVRALPMLPDVLLVNATGLDHPRRCGLALHLGYALDLPTVGVTHRPLVANGDWPPDRAGATAPLYLDGSVTGFWLRTRTGTRPLAVHSAWRTAPEVALDVVRRSIVAGRTPEPIRRARELARLARQKTGH